MSFKSECVSVSGNCETTWKLAASLRDKPSLSVISGVRYALTAAFATLSRFFASLDFFNICTGSATVQARIQLYSSTTYNTPQVS